MNWIKKDQENKRKLLEILPPEIADLAKVTAPGSCYDSDYKFDGMLKTPYTGDIPLLYEIRTNSSKPGAISFNVRDKERVKWTDTARPDLYIFAFNQGHTAWILSCDDMRDLVRGKFQLLSQYDMLTKYVWIYKKDLEEHASIIICNGKEHVPDKPKYSVFPDTVDNAWKFLLYSSSRNENPVKESIDKLNSIYNGLQSLKLVNCC